MSGRATGAAAGAGSSRSNGKSSSTSGAGGAPTRLDLSSLASSTNDGSTKGSAMPLSPNHPSNLRRIATVDLTDEYTVKSYIGAANALRDKAQAADLQGQLEQAFVNYLKAAQCVHAQRIQRVASS